MHRFAIMGNSRKIANSRLVVFFDIFAALEMPIIKELRCKIFSEMRCLSGWVARTPSPLCRALIQKPTQASNYVPKPLSFSQLLTLPLCHNNPSIFTPLLSNSIDTAVFFSKYLTYLKLTNRLIALQVCY